MKNHALVHLGLTLPSSARLGPVFPSFSLISAPFSQILPTFFIDFVGPRPRALRPGGPPKKKGSAINQSHIIRPEGLRQSISHEPWANTKYYGQCRMSHSPRRTPPRRNHHFAWEMSLLLSRPYSIPNLGSLCPLWLVPRPFFHYFTKIRLYFILKFLEN